jgi:general secretion pathway protein M
MKEWFFGLETRERRILVIGGVLAVVGLLYGLVVDPLYAAVAERRASVRENTALLRWMRQTAAAAPAPGERAGVAVSNGNFVVEFNRRASRAGLAPYLRETRPSNNGVRARFEKVPFDRLVLLIGQLESGTGLRVVNASVERGDAPGTIDARLTFETG